MINDDELWLFCQRFLSFDEPASKHANIRKLSRRLARQRGMKPCSPEEMLVTLLHPLPLSNSERLLNTIYCLEEARRFNELAFTHWNWKLAQNEKGQPVTSCLQMAPSADLKIELEEAQLGLCASAWVCYWSAYGPAWVHLKQPGPWQNDARLRFMITVLEKFDAERLSQEQPNHLARAHQLFHQLLQEQAEHLPSSFMPTAVLMVEGATEAILLPHFAELLNCSLNKLGVMLMAAGGANQVMRRYVHLKETLGLPIICLLDQDAQEQAAAIRDALREEDSLFVLQPGEIEDTFAPSVFSRLLNIYLKASFHADSAGAAISALDVAHLDPERGRLQQLSRLLKERTGIEFDKVEFAHVVVQSLRSTHEIPEELRQIVTTLCRRLQSR